MVVIHGSIRCCQHIIFSVKVAVGELELAYFNRDIFAVVPVVVMNDTTTPGLSPLITTKQMPIRVYTIEFK